MLMSISRLRAVSCAVSEVRKMWKVLVAKGFLPFLVRCTSIFFPHSHPLSTFSENRLFCSQPCPRPGGEPLLLEGNRREPAEEVQAAVVLWEAARLEVEDYALSLWLSAAVRVGIPIWRVAVLVVTVIVSERVSHLTILAPHQEEAFSFCCTLFPSLFPQKRALSREGQWPTPVKGWLVTVKVPTHFAVVKSSILNRQQKLGISVVTCADGGS